MPLDAETRIRLMAAEGAGLAETFGIGEADDVVAIGEGPIFTFASEDTSQSWEIGPRWQEVTTLAGSRSQLLLLWRV